MAFTADHTLVDVHRLVVDPGRHRQGLGRRLVQAVLDGTAAPRVEVSTGRSNAPARRLYEGLGFHPAGDVEVLPGLWVSRYRLTRRA